MIQLGLPFDWLKLRRPPDATRRVQLADGWLDYALERRHGRTIGIHVKREGVTVRAPRWASLAEIEGFLREKQSWIGERQREIAAQPTEFAWRDGGEILVLGASAVIRVYRSDKRTRPPSLLEAGVLSVTLGPSDGEPELREHIIVALRELGLPAFRERVSHFAVQLNVPVPRVALSSARGRWGSCSTKGGVRLSWRLALLPPPLMDYVIAHEVAHLVHMNHSPQFWSVVESIYPRCKLARHDLRRHEKLLPK